MAPTLNKPLNKIDIAYIEHSVGSSENQSINPLKEIFCDNIFVFTPIEKIYLFKLNKNFEKKKWY